MIQNKKTTWYVEPIGKFSNDAIARMPQICSEEDCCANIIVEDSNKKERTANLFCCPDYNFIVCLKESQSQMPEFKFRIFSKQGLYGKIRQKTYLPDLNKGLKRKIKRSKEQTKRALEKITSKPG
ncbi:MAG: hypothetical protein ABIG10_01845 [bacterium]